MSVITQILFPADARPAGGTEDPVFLTSEQRSSPHGVLRTAGGRTLRISLPRGSELADGDVLARDGETIVVVRAAAEALFRVAPDDALMWGVAGFHLGNHHRPVRFTDTAMLTPADAKVADVLRDAGLPFAAIEAPFVGRRFGSYAGHDHDHGDHDHDHHGHSHEH
ncbi:urease accessory protein UreE [Roseovarius sp.]|mgnify:FL=1|uniref:urease accessory protein UreE n=1 Tax=Roseovarius sp. TaxID=1486281 RepID=UPI0026230709|nr:urease accessory protein UreE [Roseovarius sp.]MDM8167672.1 urease accessory protein UreE [Roseovarius sp.]